MSLAPFYKIDPLLYYHHHQDHAEGMHLIILDP